MIRNRSVNMATLIKSETTNSTWMERRMRLKQRSVIGKRVLPTAGHQ